MDTFSGEEVTIPPAAVSVKLIYPAANPRSSTDVGKPFLFYYLAALTANRKSENRKGLFNVREGLDYSTASLT